MTTPEDPRRAYLRELQAIELALMKTVVDEPTWLAADDEAALRWALSLARLSQVPVRENGADVDLVDLGHAGDGYRTELFRLLDPHVKDGKVVREAIRVQLPKVRALARAERAALLRLFGDTLPPAALDRATRSRPLALALGGGGGTAYVFVGALALLEEAGITPSVIVGTSMGSILGAFRARTREFELTSVKALIKRLSWRRVFRLFETASRFGLPATLKLYLREVIGSEFERDGRFLRLCDLEVPFRVCVAGIAQGEVTADVDRYAHLLDDAVKDVRRFRRAASLARALGEISRQPLRPIYLGGDALTGECDVLDAIGFSSAVPGVVHYDILRDDPRMVALIEEVMRRHNVFRLIDGGLADNLPTREAWRAVQSGACAARDPFVLALDSFVPRLGRHMLFLPLMRLAAENTRVGRRLAHLTVSFKDVLSPVAVVPTQEEFLRAMQLGEAEMKAHIPLIRKMVGPIPDAPGVLAPPDAA